MHILSCDALLETAQTPACAASSRDVKTLGYQGSGRAQRLSAEHPRTKYKGAAL